MYHSEVMEPSTTRHHVGIHANRLWFPFIYKQCARILHCQFLMLFAWSICCNSESSWLFIGIFNNAIVCKGVTTSFLCPQTLLLAIGIQIASSFMDTNEVMNKIMGLVNVSRQHLHKHMFQCQTPI